MLRQFKEKRRKKEIMKRDITITKDYRVQFKFINGEENNGRVYVVKSLIIQAIMLVILSCLVSV